MAPTFFQELQNSEQFRRPFGAARSFSMAEMWRCVSWEKLAPFLSVTLCQSPHRGPRGEWISQRLLKIFLLLDLKVKVIYVTRISSFRKSCDDSRTYFELVECSVQRV